MTISPTETRMRKAISTLLTEMEEGYVKEKHIKRELREALDGYGCTTYDVADSRLLTTVQQQKDFRIEARNGEWFYTNDDVEMGPFPSIREALGAYSEIEYWSRQ